MGMDAQSGAIRRGAALDIDPYHDHGFWTQNAENKTLDDANRILAIHPLCFGVDTAQGPG